ncbi:MAG: hypothetical protein HY913_18865 [Desulfomonile tiedjei]|nr:hypothetical protein [Desulfomonile tiedjei]
MAISPILRDANGFALFDRGSELITKRYTGVDTVGRSISLDTDVKAMIVHIEGNSPKTRLTGTVSGSEEIIWTSDGLTLPQIPVVKEPNEPIMTLAAQSGTINVSVLAWR